MFSRPFDTCSYNSLVLKCCFLIRRQQLLPLHADQFTAKNLFHIPVVLLIFLWIQMKRVKASTEKHTRHFPFYHLLINMEDVG